MKIKQVILTLLLLSGISFSYSQEFVTFQKATANPAPYDGTDFYGCDILELSDNNIVFTQCFVDPETGSGWNDGNTDIYAVNFVKISQEAELIDTLYYELLHPTEDVWSSGFLERNPFEEDSNVYIYFAYSNDTCYYHAVYFDNDLNITDEVTQPMPAELENFYTSPNGYLIDPENNIVYVWFDRDINNYRIAKMDFFGKLKHTAVIHFKDYIDFDDDLVSLATKPLFVYNEAPLEYGLSLQYGNPGVKQIIRFDKDLNIIDCNEIDGYNEYHIFPGTYSPSIIRLDDGSFASMEHFYRSTYYPGSPDNQFLQLCKYDSDFNIIDICKVRSEFVLVNEDNFMRLDQDYYNIARCNDGSLYCLWWGNDDPDQSRVDLFVSRADKNFNLQWERRTSILKQNNHTTSGSLALEDGGLVLVDGVYPPQAYREIATVIIFQHDGTSVTENTSMFRPYSFHPNPAEDQINIRFSPDVSCEKVEIFGMDGKLCHHQNFNLNTVNISNLTNGIYMMKVTLDNGNTYTEKVVVR